MVDSWAIDSSGNPDLRLSTVNCQLPTEIIMLDFITWTADPAIFTIGSREIVGMDWLLRLVSLLAI